MDERDDIGWYVEQVTELQRRAGKDRDAIEGLVRERDALRQRCDVLEKNVRHYETAYAGMSKAKLEFREQAHALAAQVEALEKEVVPLRKIKAGVDAFNMPLEAAQRFMDEATSNKAKVVALEATLAAAEGRVGELREALERIVNWDQALLREACKSNDPFKIMEAVVTMFNRVRDSAKATLTPRAQGGLQQLVAGITDENKHPEIGFAPPLTWSQEKPTKEGWWWYEVDEILQVVKEVRVGLHGVYVVGIEGLEPITDYHGRWAGPIQPPNWRP